MKKIALLLFLATFYTIVSAQVPESFNYQVVVRDGSTNSPLTNQNVSFKMSILKGSSTGESQYSELHSANTGALGIVNLVIGNGTGKTGDITTINWGADTYYLKVAIDKTGGSSYIEMGTTQLLSVPYSMYAKNSATASNAVTLTGNQTVAGNKTFTGTTTVATPVNATDAATKAYVDVLLERIEILEGSIAKDIDGNSYGTVEIGSQIWMTENLRTTHYKDGTAIPLVPNAGDWFKLSTPGYCWYNNDEATYKTSYGALYNWYAVASEKLCPTGWHVATDADWTALTTYLGGESVAGGKLKETGITHWFTPNTAATNEIGFTALPGGSRSGGTGAFGNIRNEGYWWSSTEYSSTYAWYRSMTYNSGNVIRHYSFYDKKYGYSVRCVKN